MLDELLINIKKGFEFFGMTNPITLLGMGAGLVGLWGVKEGLKEIREAKTHGIGVPIGAWSWVIVGGILVLVMGIIVAIGVAERNSPKTIRY